MKRTIWYMYHPEKDRDFASTTPPSEEWARIQRDAGYTIVSFDVHIPDPSQGHLGTVVLEGVHR